MSRIWTCDAFYFGVELLRRPELRASRSWSRARARGRSSRPRPTRHAGTGSGRPSRPRGRAGCAPRRSSSRPTSRPTARCRASHGAGARPGRHRRGRRPRRGLPRPDRQLIAARRHAPPGVGDPAAHGDHLLDRHRPEQARGEGGLRRREARGLRRAHAASRRASASPAPRRGCCPGIGAKTAERLEAIGHHDDRALAATPGRRWPSASAAGSALPVPRARFEDDRPVTSERVAVSESRETTFPTDIADRAEQVAVLRAARRRAVRRASPSTAPRAHDRDQGAPRRLHDRDPGADPARRPRTTPRSVVRVACALLARVRAAAARAAARRAGGGVRRGRLGRRVADDARALGPRTNCPWWRGRGGSTMVDMTDTRTASQIITDEVTSWPGVEAGIGSRGEWGFTLRSPGGSGTCTATASRASASPGRWEELYAGGPHRVSPGVPRQGGLGLAPDRGGRGRRARRDRGAPAGLRPRRRGPTACRRRSPPRPCGRRPARPPQRRERQRRLGRRWLRSGRELATDVCLARRTLRSDVRARDRCDLRLSRQAEHSSHLRGVGGCD